MLNPQQLQQFGAEGYLVLPGLFSSGAMKNLKRGASDIVTAYDPEQHRSVFSTLDGDRGRDRYFLESAEQVSCFLEADAVDSDGVLLCPKERSINKIGHALHDLDPVFNAFCRQQTLWELLRDLGYQDASLYQSMYIFKQPGIGGEVRWHQDATYLLTEPRSVVGFWVAVDDARCDNGCLWVEPGGHLGPLREIFAVTPGHASGRLKTVDAAPWPTRDQAIALEVPVGSLVIFDGMLPHYSSHNHSSHSRHAFSMHFAESASAWAPENWLQRPRLGLFRATPA